MDAYSRSNAIKKAFDIAEEMRQKGTPPDTVIWRIIRDAAQRCGKGDLWAKLKPSWVSNLHAASLERQGKPDKRKFGGRNDRNSTDKATSAGVDSELEEGKKEGRSTARSGLERDAMPSRQDARSGERERGRGAQNVKTDRTDRDRRTSPRREAGGSRSPRRDRGGPRERDRTARNNQRKN